MSALAIPPSPRLRAVSAASAQEAAGPVKPLRQARRGHLRLVAPETSAADGDADLPALPLELTRRPAPVRRAPRLNVEELAPAHPAVRAARVRREQAAVPLCDRVERRPRPIVTTRPEVPAALRRLVLAVACVLAVVLIAAAAVVASGFTAAPERTVVTTVQPGQSIWELAAATGSSDVAETAAQIVELNNLTSSTLQAGQTLIVPAD